MIVAPAQAAPELEEVRALIREYGAGIGLHLSFGGFEAELARLPGRYAPPGGTLLLARAPGGQAAGCVGVRSLAGHGACEIKRLYVRPEARGTGLGRALVRHAIAFAAGAGYARVMLDTLPEMAGAQALYRAMEFTEVPPYGEEVVPGMLFFARTLDGAAHEAAP